MPNFHTTVRDQKRIKNDKISHKELSALLAHHFVVPYVSNLHLYMNYNHIKQKKTIVSLRALI